MEEAEGLTIDAATEEQMEKTERYQLFRDKFQDLGADCRQIMTLFFEKRAMSDISKIMGHGSEGYTRKRKHQCQHQLIELIKGDPRFDELK